MSATGKQLSNPFSTGGGGGHFEAHVQASFVALMLACGYAPCLPNWPITKIKLQGKFAGYDTDDLIVFVAKQGDTRQSKILAQIKHTISITAGSNLFREVVQSAWKDFNDDEVFTKNHDVIALITGPLSATDISEVRAILEWSRHSEDANEFLGKVELANFSSQGKRDKLHAFKTQLEKANGGTAVSDNDLFDFLRHFHLLGYDLDIKAGVTLSLLHSLIGQHSQDNVSGIWARLVDEVQEANKNAGTITPESLPVDLCDKFRPCAGETVIPAGYTSPQPMEKATDWNQHEHAADFSIVSLIGAWNEESEADRQVIERLSGQDYASWVVKIREIMQIPDSPLVLKNKKWGVKDRRDLWDALGGRIFDAHLDVFKECALRVLGERDPQFDLPSEERYAASVHGKVLVHSKGLRTGVAQGLALIATRGEVLKNCSQGKPESIAALTVRGLLQDVDWVQWGSLNDVMTLLAEANPDEFLSAVDNAVVRSPCPFVELFAQEGVGITGTNYLTGLLWGVELLAWDPSYLVHSCVTLANLAMHDPGGQWSNRPANSLATILLPWLPQTTASIEKRKAVLHTLIKETPTVAWRLLFSLLPGYHQSSSGTHKPEWRETIPKDWEKGVSHKEYWEQVSFYSDLAVDLAATDIERLGELISRLDNLPMPAFEKVLKILSSSEVAGLPEEQRVRPWTRLMNFAAKHRKFSDAKWALPDELLGNVGTTPRVHISAGAF